MRLPEDFDDDTRMIPRTTKRDFDNINALAEEFSGENIDRIARPWLIRRFVDPMAKVLFVEPSQVMNDDAILTFKELASYLKIAEKTAYKFVAERKISGFKVGGSWRFCTSEIDYWIQE